MNLIYSISSLLPRTTRALYARKRVQIGGLTHLSRQGGMKQAAKDWLNRTDATGGNGLLNGKNERGVRTGLTGVCQLLYSPISCPHWPPLIGALFPPIHQKEISNDRTRPMKADQGFYSLAKRAHYSASITEVKAMRPIDQPKSIFIKENEWEAGPVYIARVIFTSPPLFLYLNSVSKLPL